MEYTIPLELRPFLDEQGRLTAFPAKRKKKLMALEYLASKLTVGETYTEDSLGDLLDRAVSSTTTANSTAPKTAANIGQPRRTARHLFKLSIKAPQKRRLKTILNRNIIEF